MDGGPRVPEQRRPGFPAEEEESGALRFGVLGPVRAWRDGETLATGSPQQRALLAALLLREGRTATAGELIDALWGEEPPSQALAAVRTYASRLRKVLDPGVLVSESGGYAVRGLAEGALDLARAQDLASAAEKARSAGDLCHARDLLRRALDLWDGEVLAGVPGPYAQTQRVRLGEWRLQLLETRLDMDLDQGCHAEAVSELTALTAAHPLRERLRELLMLALYRSGRQAEALAVYADTRRLLADELGVDPRPGLQELQQRILQADPALAELSAATAETATATLRPAQLPATVSDFTGRAAFVRELSDVLSAASGESASGRVMAVSALAGIGGVGKTTLAVHVAHRARAAFPDGQLYVDLQGAGARPAEPETVLGSFLRALGTADSAIPDSLEERAALYRSVLDGRRVLVLLDNARDAAQVRPLLPGTDGCAALVTARVRMVDLAGAHLVDLDVMAPEEALALFTKIVGEERVASERRRRSTWSARAVSCRWRSASPRPGWPPAAPGRSRSWPRSWRTNGAGWTSCRPATRRSRPPSNWATASWNRPRPALPPAGPGRRPGHLPRGGGGRTGPPGAGHGGPPGVPGRHLAARIGGPGPLPLPRPGPPLRACLRGTDGTGRERAERAGGGAVAAAGLLPGDGGGGVRDRAAGGPAGGRLEPTEYPGLTFTEGSAALDWLYTEAAPLLACVRQSAGTARLRRAVDLLWAAKDLTESGANSHQYEATARAMCDATGSAADTRAEGRARTVLSDVLLVSGRIEHAEEEARLAMRLAGSAEDSAAVSWVANNRGLVCLHQRRYAEGKGLFHQAIAGFRATDNRAGEASALSNLSRAQLGMGNVAEAVDIARQGLAVYAELGRTMRLANGHFALGVALTRAGRHEEALGEFAEALDLFGDHRQRLWEGATNFRLAEVHLAAGRPSSAAQHAEQALALGCIGGDRMRGNVLALLGRALSALGQADRARACWREALSLYEQHDAQEVGEVRALLARSVAR